MRCARIYIYFKDVLKRRCPERSIDLKELKYMLGIFFHVPEELRFHVIRDLVEHKIVIPASKLRWREFAIPD